MTSSHITVYGIPNCDTVKKARAWLTSQGLAYDFHDFKKQGVPAAALPGWLAAVGRSKLLNRQGTTWRKLDPQTQAAVTDDLRASELMQAHASVIKRPVVEWRQGERTQITVGFDPVQWEALHTGAQPD
ncbi:MAG: arsenate reductase [Burkholderiaceae bacterium]|nr:arsenate reductase [Burkholderiaceae bacterium]